MENNPINLFQSQGVVSPKLAVFERYLRAIRTFLLVIVVGIGAMTLIVYSIFFFQRRTLDGQRQELFAIVKENVVKEALLLTLRARVSSLKNIMTYQISIAPYIDTTLLIAAPPRLSSFSLGDGNSIHIGVETQNVEDAVSVIQTVMQLTNENKIKNPTITSIFLNKDATVTLGFTYTVIL